MVSGMDEWDQLLELANMEAGLSSEEAGATWVTLADAASQCGVSRSALRTWYRTGQLPSRVVDGPHGPQRLVPLEVVVERAGQSPRIARRAAQPPAVEAEVAVLREQVADLLRRVAALEGRT